jgi:CRISPR-associated protein Cas5d
MFPPLEVKVGGKLACFTRPEMKVERVSYPVMTPSAARGVLEAILWKPEMRWEVREIHVLKPIRHFSILRNEVNRWAVTSTALTWPENGGAFYADDDRTRAQRHTLALRDVGYLIRADLALTREQPQGRAQRSRVQFLRPAATRRIRSEKWDHGQFPTKAPKEVHAGRTPTSQWRRENP